MTFHAKRRIFGPRLTAGCSKWDDIGTTDLLLNPPTKTKGPPERAFRE